MPRRILQVMDSPTGWTGGEIVSLMSAVILRPVQYRSGIFIEHYYLTSADDRHVTITYHHLERSRPLARHFNPKRLPD